ncbi:13762_t:CDS:10, partial [Acaulospora morrowiae]
MSRSKTRRHGNEAVEEQSFSRTSSTPGEGSNKRMRLGDNSPSASSTPSRKGKSTQEEYQIGSIVRVCLKNFVTYDSVEFRPGPNLNMVIGPNGTGKSTIVCAIALGLGWNTSLLGRAKEISDFVKHGQERASIEIELKDKSKNVVVSRTIKKSNNNSQWKLNGKIVNHKEVQSKMASLNIQVDNLCQFLPQDKVSEFAQMTPPELLVQTQRAVGEKELITWHERLIKLREEEKKLSATAKGDSDEIDNLEKRNIVLERDVTRFREKEAILRRVRLYELRIPFARYGVAKNLYDEIKKERTEVHSAYICLLKENEPANVRKSALENLVRKAANEKKRCSESYGAKKREMEGTAAELEEAEGDIDNARKELSEIKKREKLRQNKISQLQTEIKELEEKTEVPPPGIGASDIKKRYEDVLRRLSETSLQTGDVLERMEKIKEDNKILRWDMESLQKQFKELEDVKRHRLEALSNDHDTMSAIEWLEQNKDKLVAHVYNPICLEIDIKDMRYADAVEYLLGNSMRTFVCESSQDYHTVTKALCDNRKLKINVICISHLNLNNFPSPMSIQQLRAHGFESYLLDQIDAPPMLLTAICDQANFHRIPVARSESDVDHKEILRRPEIKKYIAGDTSYSITSSRYGKRLNQSYTTKIRPARIFTNTLNVDQRRDLERQLQEVQLKWQENDKLINRLRLEETKLNEASYKLREEKGKIIEEKRKIQAAYNDFQKNKVKL